MQCINVALNILEDFKEKKKANPKSKLFVVAYDQVKAYDSVQAYTIKASLERFNFPEPFVEYVLSNLKSAVLLQNILWANGRYLSSGLGQTRRPSIAVSVYLRDGRFT